MITGRTNRRRGRRNRLTLWIAACCFLLGGAVPLVAFAADSETEAAYRRQFQALASDDIDGHLNLAMWCRDQEAYDLLLKECNHILKLVPNHTQARLLLDLAKAKLGSSSDDEKERSSGGSVAGTIPGAHIVSQSGLVSPEQIQILRRKELKRDQIERVTVRFDHDVIDRLWDFIDANEGASKQARLEFNKLPPAVKAQQMLAKIDAYERTETEDTQFKDEYSADIVIESDPLVFKAFKTNAWKTIESGCASARCHGGDGAAGFALHAPRVMHDADYYTNFLVLQSYEKNGMRLIDRDRPENSLLIVYGLPIGDDQTVRHPIDIKPVFRSLQDRRLQALYGWIQMLPPPAPDYGFTVDDLK